MTRYEEQARELHEMWCVAHDEECDIARDIATALEAAHEAGVKEERERCAKICETEAAKLYDHAKGPYLDCAARIRKGSVT
jgi:hypothetical protein